LPAQESSDTTETKDNNPMPAMAAAKSAYSDEGNKCSGLIVIPGTVITIARNR
jgi:hypothetical protein